MKALVMAGGEGSRLRPLTSRTPKPLAPVANKPVMEHILDLLRHHGITDIVATLHYLADEVESYFGDGSAFGVALSYVVEDTPLGTAGAVKLAAEQLGDEPFLVISGDALTDLDLSALIDDHRRSGADATITLQRVTTPLEFGVVVMDDARHITRFLEKPSWGEIFSDTINTGIYVLDPGVLNYMERGKSYDFSRDIFPRMLHEQKVVSGFIAGDYWTDIGNLQQYLQANYDALGGKVGITIPGTRRESGVWIGEGCRVDPQAQLLGPVVLGRNVTVDAGAVVGPDTVVGNNTIVARHARIERSVFWNDGYVGESTIVTGATVADHNIIKDHVAVGDGAVIGSGCTLGAGAVVRPNLKLWPDKSVSSGSIVSMSLIYGIKWPGSLFGAIGVSGLANVELTPEFALKLGQALGSSLKPRQTVMTSRDAHPAARVLNRCVISGLLSVGVNVEDLRALPLPLARYATRMGGSGGVHTRVDPGDPNAVLIEVMDASGINVDKSSERKIENLFFREDFRRTGMDEVGTLSFPARTLELYTSDMITALRPRALPESHFKVIVDYGYGNASLVLPRVLANFGVDIVALDAYYDEAKARTFRTDRERYIDQLRTVTLTLGADLGVLVDHDGESFALVDDRGRVIAGNRLLALIALMVCRARPGATIAMPITTPHVIEELIASVGGHVTRTKSDRRSMMALAATDRSSLAYGSGFKQEPIFPEFQPAFDALYAIVKVLELLAAEGRRLHEFNDMLPTWYFRHKVIACPWERKGEVMRSVLDEYQGADVEMFDGVRIAIDGGWFLVLPDASDPAVNVYAEGRTNAEADHLIGDIAQRIETLVEA
ncbi:MAG: NTP transferase domain-containing protein [Candidatus Eremiobacteraeota bacterium]|nr:NTP transferase domain-containing protein [Candidatus Eremiobacteraeota bacterium]